jgi:exo-1,4-beta-D-glucosaminidase
MRSVAPDGVLRAFTLPPASGSEPLFLKLSLTDATGRAVSSNFYWLPPQPTEFDWAKSDGMSTPAKRAEDLTALQSLPPAAVQAKSSIKVTGGRAEVRVTLRNAGSDVAFLIRNEVRARCGSRETLHEVLPVLWDDNYVSLLPAETRTLTAAFDLADAADPARMNAGGAAARRPDSTCQFVAVTSGWNVAEQQIRLAPSRPPAR